MSPAPGSSVSTARRTRRLATLLCTLLSLTTACRSANDRQSRPDAASRDSGDAGADRAPAWTFPDEFLFGTAVSGFQVEMGCPELPAETCRDPNSDWFQFATSEAMIEESSTHLSGDALSRAAGFRETYPADLRRAADELGSNAFRTSIEWSRIFPEATDDANGFKALKAAADPEALAYYHRMFQKIRDLGMEPLVTINHYTLPTWLHDGVACHRNFDDCQRRGWVDRQRTVRELAKYARFLGREFGDQVDWWATLNEPMAVVLPGYVQPDERRSNPPALQMEFDAAKTAFRAMIEGHARAYDAVESTDRTDADGDGDPAKTGLVYNLSPVKPLDPASADDRRAADNVFYLFAGAFLSAVIEGEFDGNLDGEARHRDDLAGRMDYLGINYYATLKVEGTDGPALPGLSPLTTFDPLNLKTEFNRPEGLYETCMYVERTWDLPVVVTENGTTVKSAGDGPAGQNVGPYLLRHLAALGRASRDGADVRGYFYWSLLDTYEWNRGMDVRMGLYGFDPNDADKTRRRRPGADVFEQVAREHGVTTKLWNRYVR